MSVWWFLGCCEREMTYPVCRQLCSYDSLLYNLENPDLFVCLRHLRSLVGCIIGSLVYVYVSYNFSCHTHNLSLTMYYIDVKTYGYIFNKNVPF